MCELCGCQADRAIERRTLEHDRALDHVPDVELAARSQDTSGAHRAGAMLITLLGPHRRRGAGAVPVRWLGPWTVTVDEAHSGRTAQRAKGTAGRIATALQRQLAGDRALLRMDGPRPVAGDRARSGTATMPARRPTFTRTTRRPLDQMEDARG